MRQDGSLMTTLRVYVYKGCDTCRKALKYLERRGIAYETLPIREQPPKLEELERMLQALNGHIRGLFNTAGQDYRSMNLKEKLPNWSESEALKALSQNGNLVKRPFALMGKHGVVGFREPEWDALLKEILPVAKSSSSQLS